VKEGDVIDVDSLQAQPGQEQILDKLLLTDDGEKQRVGQPYLKGGSVTAELIRHFKAPKVTSFKYRRRKGYHVKKGHRQRLSQLRIKEIKA
jgi:large subunit ribosomal protein L21